MYIVVNWKMNLRYDQAIQLVDAVVENSETLEEKKIEFVLCPPYPYLYGVSEKLEGTKIKLGAQNLHWEQSGNFTGEVSAQMLEGLCQYCIIGHSERRQYFFETDALVNKKVVCAIDHNIIPIICVGENESEREKHETEYVVTGQLEAILNGIAYSDIEKIIVAYEPVWAIGNDIHPSEENVKHIESLIRKKIEQLYDSVLASSVPILYGGSVNSDNAKKYSDVDGIHGVLVGRASLDAEEIGGIVASL
jgi:triosephosphate isomerase